MFYRCDLTCGWLGPNWSCFITLKCSSLCLAPRTLTHFSKQMPVKSEHVAAGSARSKRVWRPTHESCKLGIVRQSTLEHTCTLHIFNFVKFHCQRTYRVRRCSVLWQSSQKPSHGIPTYMATVKSVPCTSIVQHIECLRDLLSWKVFHIEHVLSTFNQ